MPANGTQQEMLYAQRGQFSDGNNYRNRSMEQQNRFGVQNPYSQPNNVQLPYGNQQQQNYGRYQPQILAGGQWYGGNINGYNLPQSYGGGGYQGNMVSQYAAPQQGGQFNPYAAQNPYQLGQDNGYAQMQPPPQQQPNFPPPRGNFNPDVGPYYGMATFQNWNQIQGKYPNMAQNPVQENYNGQNSGGTYFPGNANNKPVQSSVQSYNGADSVDRGRFQPQAVDTRLSGPAQSGQGSEWWRGLPPIFNPSLRGM